MKRSSRVVAACLVVAAAAGAACKRGGTAEGAEARAATPSVSVSPVTAQDDPVLLEATGSFQAEESSEVAPEASGRVIATPVDVGQFVRDGAVLVR